MEKETIPATEESLQLEVDDHRMNAPNPARLSAFHPVLVDGIEGTAAVGAMGGYSTRLVFQLETPHPDFGVDFGTKHFRFLEPGLVEWGHDGKQFTLLKIIN
jgi:hypothetical protein